MKKGLTLAVIVCLLFSVLALQAFAWSANINGEQYDFDFPTYTGVGSMPSDSFFNEEFQNHVIGYSFNNGVFYRQSQSTEFGGDVRGIFNNGSDVVELIHNSKISYPPNHTFWDNNFAITSISDENSFNIQDNGGSIQVYNPTSNRMEAVSPTEETTEITETYYDGDVRYQITANLFEKTLTIKRVVREEHEIFTWVGTTSIEPYQMTQLQGLRLYTRFLIPPSWFRIDNFQNQITVAPGGFIENPNSFALGYRYQQTLGNESAYHNGYSEGYSEGFQNGDTQGFGEGYQVGLTDGEERANKEFRETYANNAVFGNFFNGFGSAVWTFIDNIFSFELFPDLTVGTIALVFIGAGIVIVLLKLLISTKGGGV